MPPALRARYASAFDLLRHLDEHTAQGALLLPLPAPPEGLRQFERIGLEVWLGEERAEVQAEVLQVLPGVGLAVRLIEPELARELLSAVEGDGGSARGAGPAVEVSLIDQSEAPAVEEQPVEPQQDAGVRGLGPLSWTIEKLQADWHSLSMSDRFRVAKYGKRGARGLILRMTDNALHNVLLSNPQITADEVAILAGTGSVDNTILKRILGSPEWVRHAAVARNLVCHPKATLQQASKAADHLSDNEIRQLTRTGKVRASVKRLLMKKLEQRSVRARR